MRFFKTETEQILGDFIFLVVFFFASLSSCRVEFMSVTFSSAPPDYNNFLSFWYQQKKKKKD